MPLDYASWGAGVTPEGLRIATQERRMLAAIRGSESKVCAASCCLRQRTASGQPLPAEHADFVRAVRAALGFRDGGNVIDVQTKKKPRPAFQALPKGWVGLCPNLPRRTKRPKPYPKLHQLPKRRRRTAMIHRVRPSGLESPRNRRVRAPQDPSQPSVTPVFIKLGLSADRLLQDCLAALPQ